MANNSFFFLDQNIKYMHVVGDNACKTAWGHIIHNTIPAFRERIEALFVVKYSNFCKCSMEACKDRLYIFIKNINVYVCIPPCNNYIIPFFCVAMFLYFLSSTRNK